MSILGLSRLGLREFQQVSVVLHNKVSLFEAMDGKHPPSLSFDVFDLSTIGDRSILLLVGGRVSEFNACKNVKSGSK